VKERKKLADRTIILKMKKARHYRDGEELEA
jgi:hypothetical protein